MSEAWFSLPRTFLAGITLVEACSPIAFHHGVSHDFDHNMDPSDSKLSEVISIRRSTKSACGAESPESKDAIVSHLS